MSRISLHTSLQSAPLIAGAADYCAPCAHTTEASAVARSKTRTITQLGAHSWAAARRGVRVERRPRRAAQNASRGLGGLGTVRRRKLLERVNRTPRRRSTPQRDNRSGGCTYVSKAPHRPERTVGHTHLLDECHRRNSYAYLKSGYRHRARRKADCYNRTLPPLLHGHALAWAATGKLAPTT